MSLKRDAEWRWVGGRDNIKLKKTRKKICGKGQCVDLNESDKYLLTVFMFLVIK